MDSNAKNQTPETRCPPTGFGNSGFLSLAEKTVEGVPFSYASHIPVPHGFSTRLGGVSAGIFTSMNLGHRRGDDPEKVRKNYELFCKATKTNVNRIVMANQVHGNFVKQVSSEDVKKDLLDPAKFEADGLVTNTPGITLVVFSADCIPILLYDPVEKVVAALHAGWRGTAKSIGAQGVRAMMEYGSKPENIRAAIGPGIGPECFETDEDVPEAMEKELGSWTKAFFTPVKPGGDAGQTGGGPGVDPGQSRRFRGDLKGINGGILGSAGVLPEHIRVSDECTCCQPEKYWSHRFTKGQRGSQAAMILLPEK